MFGNKEITNIPTIANKNIIINIFCTTLFTISPLNNYNIFFDKPTMLFVTIIVIIGIISGSLFAIALNNHDKESVINSIQTFVNNINKATYNYIDSSKNIFIGNALITLAIWLLGISIIGVFIIIVCLFWKAFTLGFSISGFILAYNLKGLFLAVIYIFPPLIINLLIFMYLSTYSIRLSLLLIKSIVQKKNINFKHFMNNYIKVLLIILYL